MCTTVSCSTLCILSSLQVLHAAAAGVDECKVPESPVVLKLEASPPKPYKTLPRKTGNYCDVFVILLNISCYF